MSSRAIAKGLNKLGFQTILLAADEVSAFTHLKNSFSTVQKSSIVHIYGLWSLKINITAIVALALGKPLVVSPIGMLEKWSLRQSRLKKSIALFTYQGFILKRASCIHATSQEERVNINKVLKNAKVVVIPHGVEMPDSGNKSDLSEAEKHQIIKRVLFLSRLHKKKGIEELLDAWKVLFRKDVELLIAGSGEPEYVSKINNAAKQLTLEGYQIKLLGDVRGNEKTKLYVTSSLFVLPTFSENFGLVISEAISHGLPIITTPYAPWSWVSAVNAGLIVEPNVKDLTDALNKMLTISSAELRSMGINGRTYLEQNYSWQKASVEHSKNYIRIIEYKYNRII